MTPDIGAKVVFDLGELDRLIANLAADGIRVIGPKVGDGAIVYDEVTGVADLPAGWRDTSEPGRYRLTAGQGGALFGYTVAAQGWKRHLHPPRQRLFKAERSVDGFRLTPAANAPQPTAFLGVRACELVAIGVLDRVFDVPGFGEPGYLSRRRDAIIIAVECAGSASTCFCASTGSGPAVERGYDLLLNEIADGALHVFVAEAGSERGQALLAGLTWRAPTAAERSSAQAQPAAAAAQQVRHLDADAPGLLARSRESPHWDRVAERCLTCGNCTMVCPTCFCTTVEDITDLSGDNAERWRRWDSCFTIDYSYIHGGSVRRTGASRYRQWISHKLSTWYDQFGTSGCVGCGRCIAWCPVGIDITAEVGALREAEEVAAVSGEPTERLASFLPSP